MSEQKEKKKRGTGILKDYWNITYDLALVVGAVIIVAPVVILIIKGIKEFWNLIM